MTDLFEEFPPAEVWDAFLDHRKKLKKPMTEYAERLMIKKLRAYEANGQNAQAMLEQSMIKGWLDVFPVKEDTPPACAPRRYPARVAAPETADERDARRSRWGIPATEIDDAPY